MDPSERFHQRVTTTDHGLMWAGPFGTHGYGRYRMFGEQQAHRVAWILANGAIPDGLCVLHKCDTPPCVTPEHLFLGTQTDNMADMWAKGRQAARLRNRLPKRVKPKRNKLEPDDVRLIRRALAQGEPAESIAAAFGVTARNINHIRSGQTWSRLP